MKYYVTMGRRVRSLAPSCPPAAAVLMATATCSTGLMGIFTSAVSRATTYYVTTGRPAQFLDVFIGDDPATTSVDESGGLDAPTPFVFDSVGNVYVVSFASNQVLKYDASGTFIGEFIAMEAGRRPGGIAFGPDGDLYLGEWQGHRVVRYDAVTGQRLAVLLDDPLVFNRARSLLFDHVGNLLVTGGDTDNIARIGTGPMVTLSYPSTESITVDFASMNWTAVSPDDYIGTTGKLTFAPGETMKRVLLTTVDDAIVEGPETLTVTLSNPGGGATISDPTGVVTITDDDSDRRVSINSVAEVEGDQTPHYRGGFVDGHPGGHFNPLTFGPDGNIYTAVGTGIGYNTIQRFDGTTGAFIDTFIDNSDPDHRINGVRDIVFHPSDGKVYVARAYTEEVLRFDAVTGEFVDVFVSAGAGGIMHPDGMMFGPDANDDGMPELYVTGWLSHSVVRYDGMTGATLGTFVTAGSGGLSYPFSLAFRNDELFVTSAGTNQILKYEASSGNFLGVAASTGLDYPRGLTFGPDDLLYVTSGSNDRILRFMPDGTYVDDYIPAGVAGMANPRTPRFGPDGDLYVTVTGKNEIMRFGDQNEAVFTVSLSTASNSAVAVDFATSPIGTAPATQS